MFLVSFFEASLMETIMIKHFYDMKSLEAFNIKIMRGLCIKLYINSFGILYMYLYKCL